MDILAAPSPHPAPIQVSEVFAGIKPYAAARQVLVETGNRFGTDALHTHVNGFSFDVKTVLFAAVFCIGQGMPVSRIDDARPVVACCLSPGREAARGCTKFPAAQLD